MNSIRCAVRRQRHGDRRSWLKWYNVAVLRLMDRHFDRGYRRVKGVLFADMPVRILELGPGVGANLRHYPKGSHVVGVEPNLHAHPALAGAARQSGLDLTIVAGEAERLPMATASVDVVVGTLLLCSVRDPEAALQEIRRVLRPDGRFLGIEHVAAPAGSMIRAWQVKLAGVWRWLFDGCELCRETERMVCAAGFREVVIDRLTLPTFVFPLRLQIVAVCIR